MKTFLFLFVFIMTCIFTKGQTFSNVTLGSIQDRPVVSFTLSHETNVRYYRIEASNDSISYDFIGTVRSTGNSVLAKSYQYELPGPVYRYYRVVIVCMNANLQYSAVLTAQKKELPEIEWQNIPTGATIVNKQ